LGGFEINGQVFYPFIQVGGSEVGASSSTFTGGILQAICANHTLRDVLDACSFRVVHVGDAYTRFSTGFLNYVQQWTAAGTLAQRQAIQAAMEFHCASDEKGAAEFLQAQKFTKRVSLAAVQTVLEGDRSTGIISEDPTNLFNLVSAITANIRQLPNQDEKALLGAQAGRLMALASR
ncbi:MAG: hypothetical protein M0P73_16340, partial [Syntrophobacterales bacterium]|nr:hypothetical protein [Syntrophobacterales bacterium]